MELSEILIALGGLLSAIGAWFARPAVDRARERKRRSVIPEDPPLEIPKPPQVPQ